MILIVLLALVVALGLLAHRYGYDSRDRLYSAEAEFAASGMTWPEGLSDAHLRTGADTAVAKQPRVRLLTEKA